ncbi:hypothetical protein EXIGLDRAFT_736698 [Exidia glandulosa HHB12029]|uniref:DUF7053 domain-containing protein n=1 Tax=Exidia glandulosa HHB12029 TaxID=1314781 RepID=A0A165PBU3_EXIGL|nr:hypothetical protein EXIGLDRAFT_736698 [Exidia glandulosa HHB12029]
MPFLSTTRTIKSSRVVKASLPDALRAVQDPRTLIQLNPLVISCKPDERDNTLWHIVDRLKILCISTTTKYTARFKLVQDGIDCDTHASGVHIINKWRVTALGDGRCEVSEEAILTTSKLLVGYVHGQIKTSHAQMLETMAAQMDSKEETDKKEETKKDV